MDNAQKAIMIGVGLFITIIIISVVLLITNLGTGMVDDARDNLGNMTNSLQAQIKTQYDRKTVKGADVISLINQYKDDENFIIVHAFKTTPTATSYTYKYITKDVTSSTSIKLNELKTGSGVSAVTTGYEVSSTTGSATANGAPTLVRDINSSDTYNTYVLYNGADVAGVVAVKAY